MAVSEANQLSCDFYSHLLLFNIFSLVMHKYDWTKKYIYDAFFLHLVQVYMSHVFRIHVFDSSSKGKQHYKCILK